ncbi:MAG: MFS transporter, partial [Clostridia bacterium]
YGKRTPYILIGTVCAILCFTALTFVDYAQLKNNLNYGDIKIGTKNESVMLWNANPDITISSADNDDDIFKQLFAKNQTEKLHNWILDENRIAENKADYDKALKAFINGETKVNPVKYIGYVQERSYSQWREYFAVMQQFAKTKDKSLLTQEYGFIEINSGEEFKNISFKIPKASVLLSKDYIDMPSEQLDALKGTEKDLIASKLALNPFYTDYVAIARSAYALDMTFKNPVCLIFFIVLLLATLISMSIFRSPAVALMPDVTLKPLRSKANAIINLMGTAGGMLILGLGMVFKTTDAKNALMSYIGFVLATCAVMIVALALFLWRVKENKLVAQMQAEATLYGIEERLPQNGNNSAKLTKAQRASLGLILASVALWFIGYNAITSKYSLYATNILDKDYNLTLLLAQAAAIIAYIPVGFIATKFGRKRTILVGIVMLTVAFGGGAFITPESPSLLMYALFMLAGIAWATINVNSFPMVVELAKGNNVGKYTGYYYTASMAAQIATPIFSGMLMDKLGMRILFPYGAIFVALAFITMIFVRHGDSKSTKKEVTTK